MMRGGGECFGTVGNEAERGRIIIIICKAFSLRNKQRNGSEVRAGLIFRAAFIFTSVVLQNTDGRKTVASTKLPLSSLTGPPL